MDESFVRAPEFPDDLTWWNTDHPLRLHEELRGRVVVLDFWTYCCINCLHILPDLAYLEEKYARDPVVFIGVHSNKYSNEGYPENVRQAIFRHGITHPVVMDPDHLVWGAYGVDAWPTLVVIDPRGRIVVSLSGEGHREELDRMIAALLEIGRDAGVLAEGPLSLRPEPLLPAVSGLRYPGKVLADGVGRRLFIADTNHHRILITDWQGEIQGFFGSGQPGTFDGFYDDARFQHPQGMALVGEELYIADTGNHMVRRANLRTFRIETVLGNGMIGYDRRGGHRARAQVLNSPWDLAYLAGQLYIAMAGLHQIWAFDLETEVGRAVIGTGREALADQTARRSALAQPSGLATDGDVLYFADSETSAVRQYDPRTDQVTTLVGQGLFIFGDVDGPLQEARMQHPLGVEVGNGVVYVADSYNHKIRAIDRKTGLVRTVAGIGRPARAVNERLALYEPGGLSLAGDHLFIADTNNNRVVEYNLASGQWREITPMLQGKPLSEAA